MVTRLRSLLHELLRGHVPMRWGEVCVRCAEIAWMKAHPKVDR